MDGQRNTLEWRFRWDQYLYFYEAGGTNRAFEWKATTDSGYATQPSSYAFNNFPSGSRPYRDTMQTDQGCCTFGYGAGAASYFTLGVDYTAQVGVYKEYLTPGLHDISWSVRPSTRMSDWSGCATGDQFCVFNDYTHRTLHGRDFRVAQTDSKGLPYGHNFLLNESFEDGFHWYTMFPGNDYYRYCTGGTFSNAASGSCFLEFSRGSASFGSVQQTRSVFAAAGDHLTVEAMVRCPINQAPCPITLALWALDNGQEARNVSAVLPADGRWYMCRVDYDHGANESFARAHSLIRWELYNTGNSNLLDVDFNTLAYYTARVANTFGDPAPPPDQGAACTLAF